MSYVNLFAPLETVPVDGGRPRYVARHHRCWPNAVSGEYCALIEDDAGGRDVEHWYDEEGQPIDPASPTIRNVAAKPTEADLRAAFLAGAGICDDGPDRFAAWFAERSAASA